MGDVKTSGWAAGNFIFGCGEAELAAIGRSFPRSLVLAEMARAMRFAVPSITDRPQSILFAGRLNAANMRPTAERLFGPVIPADQIDHHRRMCEAMRPMIETARSFFAQFPNTFAMAEIAGKSPAAARASLLLEERARRMEGDE